ncbi:hypothetical protein AX17_005640 [Amanita inopinata Kibby_2008]|nr:hypothetical protein AX17_005640 [Amanita inopinata Kibby_2008]
MRLPSSFVLAILFILGATSAAPVLKDDLVVRGVNEVREARLVAASLVARKKSGAPDWRREAQSDTLPLKRAKAGAPDWKRNVNGPTAPSWERAPKATAL